MLPIEHPFKSYTGLDGKPLDNGYIYIGLPNQNPLTAPIAIYWDAAGTIPASQPLRTVNGYIVRAGTPANVFVADSYSELVQDAKSRQVAYGRTSEEFSVSSILSGLIDLKNFDGSSKIGFLQVGTGGLPRTVESKLRDSVSIRDFGALGDNVNDDTAAIQNAVNSGAGMVYIPKGAYRTTSDIKMPLRVSICGDGGMQSIIYPENCDGFTFSASGFDQDSTYIGGFGIFGTAGANYTAINCPTGTGTKYGITFDSIVISDMNQGFILSNNLYCSITRCRTQFVNKPVTLGNICTFSRIHDNTFVYAGGSTHGGTAPACGIEMLGGSDCEAIKIRDNFVYGFATGVKVATVTDLLIEGNGIDACSLYGIYFTAVNYAFNIKNNFIELIGVSSVAGICGAPLGAGEYLSQINIEGNSFTSLAPVSVGSTGILFNTATDTYQWHGRIVGNVFTNMTLNDIRINLPGEMNIENNRLMSNVTTSMWLGAVLKAPVFVSKNWMAGLFYMDGSTDLSLGKMVLDHNTTSGTFVPYAGTFVPTFVSDAGAFGSITYSTNVGYYERIGNVCHFNLQLTTSSVAIGTASGILRILGLPFESRKNNQTAVAVSDSRAWTSLKVPTSAAVTPNVGAAKIALYNRATSNGDAVLAVASDLATGAGSNVISISGSYLCI